MARARHLHYSISLILKLKCSLSISVSIFFWKDRKCSSSLSCTSALLYFNTECRRSKDPEECVVQDCWLATILSCGFMGSALKGPRRLWAAPSLTAEVCELTLNQSPRLLLQGRVLIQHTKYGHFGHRKTVSRILDFFLFSLTYFHLKHPSVHF